MKNIQTKLFLLFMIGFIFQNETNAQNEVSNEPNYEVNKVYPYISIEEAKLKDAKTLADLNYKYKSIWISEYISVEIITSENGQIKKAMSKNDYLTEEQKANINNADFDKSISVLVKYIPENTLKNNEAQEMDFTFSIEPTNDAKFSDGQKGLKQYLKDSIIEKIPDGIFKGYDLAAVKFTVSEKGKIIDAHVFESSNNEKVDELLLSTIQDMSEWKPAKFANGKNVKQEFVLTVGNMKSCIVNLLSIKKYY